MQREITPQNCGFGCRPQRVGRFHGKAIRKGILAVAVLLLTSTLPTSAIEGLKLQMDCPDVVLSWPSIEGEQYRVEWREDLSTHSTWVTLTNLLSAQIQTNLTTFVHSGIVECTTSAYSSGGGGSGGPPGPESATVEADYFSTEPMVTQKKGESLVPLALYPPGIDLSGQVIIWPDGSIDEWSADLVEKWRLFQQETGGPQTEDSGDGGEPGCGFYRVVRTGLHLFGITNGTVLSGLVPIPVEFGFTDTNRTIDQVFLTDNDSDDNLPGSSFPEFPLGEGESPAGVWDTTHVTNGNYTLQLGALLDDGTVLLDTPIAVTVSNLIFQPDPWNVGGEAIYVGFQTVFTNGVWHLDVYDHDQAYLGYLEGEIDADGYCNYPGIPGPGFSLNNTDPYGNQYPNPSYTLAMTAIPSGAVPPYPIATNRVFIEPAWNYYTRAVTCYQQVFPSWAPGHDDVRLLMETVWNAVEVFHQNLLGGLTTPHEVGAQGWGLVTNRMTFATARDFVYFGHGSGNSLGGGGLTIPMVQSLLGNNLKNPLTATNMHPYRFVFLDGCNTADGNWPQAFGIPKRKGMIVTDFTQKRGIRPRAFMGWNRTKSVGTHIIAGNQLYPPHADYIGAFWNSWINGGGGLSSVEEAISDAAAAAPLAAGGMVLYGAEDLVINY
jgi:hypothetical protein